MRAPLPKLDAVTAAIASVADYEALARERVSEQAWAYVSGGAGDETTLRENVAAYARIPLRQRLLRDLRSGDASLELFGDRFDGPVLLAPVAYHKLVHPEGEIATVLAASALGFGMTVSTQASVALEAIAERAKAPLWFQLYIQPDRDFTADLVRRAEAANYRALVVTADAPVNGIRNREQRAGFALPAGIEAVNLRGMRVPAAHAQGRLLGSELLAAAPTWQDLRWLRSLTRMPILLKGVMSAADAGRALQAGVDGIVVSNHGGRTLDGQPASIEVLPEIVAAVGGRVPVLVDGGIRRGGDIFKAIRAGAAAVLIGRPYMYGLAAAGALGVAHVLQILRAELEVTMALCGCPTLQAIRQGD